MLASLALVALLLPAPAVSQHADAMPSYLIDPIPAWTTARRLWNITEPISARQARIIRLHWAHGAAGLAVTKELVYVRVWKGGNNAIRANLRARNVGRVPDDGLERCAFTFVREPFEHFASGLNELEWRLTYAKKHHRGDAMPFTSLAVGSVARARQFVHDLVALEWMSTAADSPQSGEGDEAETALVARAAVAGDGGLAESFDDNFLAFEHVRPMSGYAASIAPTFVGRLERFETDWGRLQAACGITLPVFKHDCVNCRHPSSKDPLGAYNATRALLATDVLVVRTLCLLLLADFRLFQYPLPRACAALDGRRRPRRGGDGQK